MYACLRFLLMVVRLRTEGAVEDMIFGTDGSRRLKPEGRQRLIYPTERAVIISNRK